ncbi:MAG: DUF3347 domain-containing protein [Ignavibacteria bacterium]|nr:DUF3347 domain-containing protein [Ignavibacteria bacterium]
MAVVSWGANAAHNHGHGSESDSKKMDPMFADKALGTAYMHYIHLKDALFASDLKEAKTASAELVTAAKGVADGKNITAEATKVANAGSLDDKRKAFRAVSAEMISLVKKGKLSMGEVFLFFCPDYGDGGSYWLANEKDVRNPYLGEKMPKCGTVKETIK